jgi:hypothetical protein
MTKVLYIAGWGRSGSTLLDQILGGVEGWFSCGELKGLGYDLPCGCGASLQQCAFWSRIAERMNEPLATGLVDDSKPWHLAAVGRARRRGPAHDRPRWRHAEAVTELYDLIAAETGARVIVDSSKLATHAHLIATLTRVDLHLVHLVRDPRAAAHSWGRRKANNPSGSTYLPEYGAVHSSLHWLRRNAIIDLHTRRTTDVPYLRVRYEDLVADPNRVVRRIGDLVGERVDGGRFAGQTVSLRSNHMIAGNPRRFETGEVRIAADSEWASSMPRRAQALATLPALPLLHRYGYPLRVG